MSTKPAIIIRIDKCKAERSEFRFTDTFEEGVGEKTDTPISERTEFRFTDSFQIGRGREFGVRVMDDIVSLPHVEIRF